MESRKEAAKATRKSEAAGSSRIQDPRSSRPTEEQIRQRAYELYVERGRADRQDLEDWFQAEKELTEITRRRHPREGWRAQGAQ